MYSYLLTTAAPVRRKRPLFQEDGLGFQVLVLALELLQAGAFRDREIGLGAAGGLAVFVEPIPESLGADAIGGSDVLDGF